MQLSSQWRWIRARGVCGLGVFGILPPRPLRPASHQCSPLRRPWPPCCSKGDPFQGPREGACLTPRNELSEETHVRTEQETIGKGRLGESSSVKGPGRLLCHVARSLRVYGDAISFWVVFGQSLWIRVLPSCKHIVQPRLMPARRILGSGRTHGISFWPFPNSSRWWRLISFMFLTRTSCCKITHANGYYGAWPAWGVSVSVLPLTLGFFSRPLNKLFLAKRGLLSDSLWSGSRWSHSYSSLGMFAFYGPLTPCLGQLAQKVQFRLSSTLQFSSVWLLRGVWLFATSWTAACQASLSITNSQSLLKLMSVESVMPSNHLILCYPLLLLPSIFPSIRVFSIESFFCSKWPKYWSFSFNISPSNEHSGLISFRMDWLDLLAVQGALKSLLQHQSAKAPILQCSAFFTVQLSHPYLTIGKIIALTRWTFAGKVMSLILTCCLGWSKLFLQGVSIY